jgi:hypothetical protein
MSPIFKSDPKKADAEKELDFELKYQQSLSFQELFRMMVKQSGLVLRMLINNGHRKPFEIIKRTQG